MKTAGCLGLELADKPCQSPQFPAMRVMLQCSIVNYDTCKGVVIEQKAR
jgi:hypothetical protein